MSKTNKDPSFLTREEQEACARYRKMTDEQLMNIIRQRTDELGRAPTKNDILAAGYFKQRFGPWPRILEAAGVKPPSERKKRRVESNKRKHSRMRKRSAERRREGQ